MSKTVNDSLGWVAKCTMIVFVGTALSILLGFISRVIIVRFITQEEYGIYCLSLTIINVFATIATLGLKEGSTRYIAYFRGIKRKNEVDSIVYSSIKIALISSISIAIVSFLISDFISESIFNTPNLAMPLKIFSISIPFTVLITIFIAIFRGFDKIWPSVYFQNILRNILFILLLVTLILSGLSLLGVVYAYFVSITITCIFFLIYFIKKLSLSVKLHCLNSNQIERNLLVFSIPLFITNILGMVTSWTDTLMLGYFKSPDVVGLYNGALPFANLIHLAIVSVGFIYVPIISQFYSRNLAKDIKRMYVVITKWIFLLTLPILLVLIFFPEIILGFFLGHNYVEASIILQILALAFFLDPFFGPNYYTLIVRGETSFLMLSSLSSAVINIILNITLIPLMGIIGAAIATSLSLILLEILIAMRLYSTSKIHPFTRNYLKSISLLIIIISIFYILNIVLSLEFIYRIFVFSFLFLVVYPLSLLVCGSLNNEDIIMLLKIESIIGIDLKPIKSLLKKYVRDM